MLFDTFSITNSYSYFNTTQMSDFELEILFVDWIHKFSQINTTILIQPAAKKTLRSLRCKQKLTMNVNKCPYTVLCSVDWLTDILPFNVGNNKEPEMLMF